jgi:hypothetical protein
MPTAERETVVAFSDREVSIRFTNGVRMAVTEKGELSIKKDADTFGYSPSRLRKNTATLFRSGESTEGSQRFALDEKTVLNIRTEQGERLSVEMFFHEATEEGAEISGCFITKNGDWGIRFVKGDRFLLHLDRLFALTREQE